MTDDDEHRIVRAVYLNSSMFSFHHNIERPQIGPLSGLIVLDAALPQTRNISAYVHYGNAEEMTVVV